MPAMQPETIRDGVGAEWASGRYLTWVLLCAIFWGVPLWLLRDGIVMVQREAVTRVRDRHIARVDRAVVAVERWADTQKFLQELLQSVSTRMELSDQPPAVFARMRQHLHRRFPGLFEFAYIDRQGAVVAALSDWDPPRAVVRKFVEALVAWRQGRPGLWNRGRSMFIAMLGPLFDNTRVLPNELRMAAYSNRRHYAFYSNITAAGMFIAFVHRGPDWDVVSINDRLIDLRRRVPEVEFVIFDRERSAASPAAQLGMSESAFVQLVNRLQVNPTGHLFEAEHHFVHRLVQPTVHLVARMTDRSTSRQESDQSRVDVTLVGLFLICSALTLAWGTGRLPQLVVGIRPRLLLLFLYATGLPLAVLGLTAHHYVRERQQVLETATLHRLEQALSRLDRQYPLILADMQRDLRRHFAPPIEKDEDLLKVAVERVLSVRQRWASGSWAIFDPEGNPVWTSHEVDGGREGDQAGLFKGTAAKVLRLLNNDEEPVVPPAQDAIVQGSAEALGFTIERLIHDLVLQLNRVTEFRLGEQGTINGNFPVFDRAGRARYLITVNWLRNRVELMYLRRYLQAMMAQMPHTAVYAADRRDPTCSVPRHLPAKPLLDPFVVRMRGQAGNLQTRTSFRGRSYLLYAQRGSGLTSYDLLAVAGDVPIRREIARYRREIGLVGALLIMISVVLGAVLARAFLTPIGHLMVGVTAIRLRQYRIHIPVLDHDELGRLSASFNEMAVELREVSMGRDVQQALFPHQPLSIGEYTVHGRSRPATQLGGDYFDYQRLGADDLLVIIGDVTGHGVPAALVMAMAKSIVTSMVAREQEATPIVAEVNRVINATTRKRLFMTLAAVWIQTKTHQATLYLCGHPSPFLQRRDDKIEMLDTYGLVLGMRPKLVCTPLSFTLAPGERLILYTDGLAETLDCGKVETGFDMLARYMETRPRLPALVAGDDFLDHHPHLVAELAQPDDFTVVVIERAGGMAGSTPAGGA